MNIQHTARTGQTYYLHVGQGKTGKPNYYFSMKPDGPIVDSIPPGFEIHENIRGQVFLRRIKPQVITPEEVAKVREALNRHAHEWVYKIEVKRNAIIIHETEEDRVDALQNMGMPWIDKTRLREYSIGTAHYMAVMRFLLVDQEKRLFRAERFCFRGSIDDWIDIGGEPQPLATVLRKFIKYLGKKAFYELF